MKIINLKSRKAIALSAVKCDIVIYDCATEERLLSLPTGAPLNSIHSMSTSGNLIFCCDFKKSVFTFDLGTGKVLLRVDYRKPILFSCPTLVLTHFLLCTVPSVAVNCFHLNKYLFLACQDGVIRALDVLRKPGNPLSLSGPHPKTLSCMRFSDTKVRHEICYRVFRSRASW